MARLIQIRQRINAIETIQKITHTMRLISMSTHTRLKTKDLFLKNYKQSLLSLFYRLKPHAPAWHNNLIQPPVGQTPKTLIILVGSQRGLCGSFNTVLFTLFGLRREQSTEFEHADIIAVGKKAAEYIKKHPTESLHASYDTFNFATLSSITTEIASMITNPKNEYSHVVIFSNQMKSFFAQVPRMVELVPFTPPQLTNAPAMAFEEQTWEQSPEEILDVLVYQLLEASLYGYLFESLLSEQAARFLSMDGATRNAESLLETTKLQYNKLRQAKITKELSELTGSF